MAPAQYSWIDLILRCMAAGGFLILLLPIALMIPLSLEPGDILRLPNDGLSLRWYAEYFQNDAWLASTIVSLKVALGTSALATILGTSAAVGMRNVAAPARRAFMALAVSPLVLPTIVIAVAIHGTLATMHLVGSITGLIAAHTVLTLPIVLITVSTSLAGVPDELTFTASSLGASPLKAFFTVTMPLAARGIIAGAALAFMLSFDEVVIGMFLSGADAITLPKRMLDGVFYEMTPMLAAVSTLLVLANILGLTVFLFTQLRATPQHAL